MKTLYYFISCALFILTGCNTKNSNQEAIGMLNEFYRNYSVNSFKIEDKPKLDALIEKYCTEELQQEAKKFYNMGFDLLTDEWGIEEQDLNSLKITKSLLKDETYIVSYTTDTYPVSPNIAVRRKITLNVGVIQEDGTYKINSVKAVDMQ